MIEMLRTMTSSRRQAASVSPISSFPAHHVGSIGLEVAGISFHISSRHVPLVLESSLAPFANSDCKGDVEIEAEWADEIPEPSGSLLFTSGGLWSAYRENDGVAFYFRTSYFGTAPYKKAWFDSEWRSGRVQLLKRYFDPALPVYPLEYPLDELLMIHRLASGEGAEIHACGVASALGGTLFVGHSGAGKSTTSRMWNSLPDTLVLSDDRIILRAGPNGVQMHGTPWHGDAGIAAQAFCKLDRILILEHGARNEIVPLNQVSATAELFTRTFVPHYDEAAIHTTMRFLEQVVAQVPVSRFRFVPDESAVEAILRAA